MCMVAHRVQFSMDMSWFADWACLKILFASAPGVKIVSYWGPTVKWGLNANS